MVQGAKPNFYYTVYYHEFHGFIKTNGSVIYLEQREPLSTRVLMMPSLLILGVSGQVDTFGFDPKEEGSLPSPPANLLRSDVYAQEK